MSQTDPQSNWARFSKRPRRPRIKVGARPPKRGVGGFLATGLLVAMVLGAAVGGVLWSRGHRPDEHFVRAVELLSDYERGKDELQRNYGNAVYRTALGELEQVDPQSASAEPARQLERLITRKIGEFRDRLAEEARALQRAREVREKRITEAIELRRYAREHPRTYYPECEHPSADGHNHTH